jgi:metallo-beta-lactamase class B
MHRFARPVLLFAICFSLLSIPASAQKVNEPANRPAEWSQPYTPFRIAGNLYYVGTYDLACYLIVTDKGNILINTGLANSFGTIKKNISTLGFKMSDTRILLTTQAHYDHVGAMAAVKKATGAAVMVNDKDSAVMADGGASDYALGGHGSLYVPVPVDRYLHNGDSIVLGNMKLIMLHHPGHTKGSSSFLFTVSDKQQSYKVLIANMPTIVTDEKFIDIKNYSGIVSDYAYTLKNMKQLSFDIWLASHAGQFDLHTKHKPGDAYNPRAFADQKGYEESINDLQAEYDKKIKEQ